MAAGTEWQSVGNRYTPRQVFRAREPAPAADPSHPYCPRCGGACDRVEVGGRRRSVCGWCGHVQYRNPSPAIALAIVGGGRILLGKRAPACSFAGLWALPAGFIEFDEDFLTAGRREAREETGLEVAVTGILGVSSNHLSERLHALVVALAATAIGGELEPGPEFSELQWIPTTGPFPPLAYEADAELLARFATRSRHALPVDRRYAEPRRAGELAIAPRRGSEMRDR